MLRAYTWLHVVISLVGIVTGLVVVAGMLMANPLNGWTSWFLATTMLTSVTGFFFPYTGFKPSYVVGAISVVVLAVTYAARYHFEMAGPWRWIYVVTAVLALYFNVFVLIVQAFRRVPALQASAPTQTEPPFKAAQLANLAAFVVLGTLAVMKFRF
jgi:hypothetical protein